MTRARVKYAIPCQHCGRVYERQPTPSPEFVPMKQNPAAPAVATVQRPRGPYPNGTVWPLIWLEKSDRARVELRRYRGLRDGEPRCEASGIGFHNAETIIDEIPATYHGSEHWPGEVFLDQVPDVAHDDPRWPTHCACGYAFGDSDHWQTNTEQLYTRSDGGPLVTLFDAPVGAMWDTPWMGELSRGHDGIHLAVRTPAGEWLIDHEASNCRKTQFVERVDEHGRKGKLWNGRTHWCWPRHGDPRRPETMDVRLPPPPDRPHCGGSYSIGMANWHGYLEHGTLVQR